jgi:hypothetical protein
MKQQRHIEHKVQSAKFIGIGMHWQTPLVACVAQGAKERLAAFVFTELSAKKFGFGHGLIRRIAASHYCKLLPAIAAGAV